MDGMSFLVSSCILTYIVLTTLFSSGVFAFLLTCGLVILLNVYRIPKSVEKSATILDKVSKSHIIAHKGAALDAPENTIAAFKLAKKNGADAVEFDVDYTSDGIAVLIHDDTVDRTTDGTGSVNSMTLSAIQSLNAAAKHPKKAQFSGEKVPTLEDGVRTCLELGLFMYIDVKTQASRTAEVLADLYKKFPAMYEMAAVCSFDPRIVYQVRRQLPDIVTGLTHRPYVKARDHWGNWREEIPSWKRPLMVLFDIVLQWAQYQWLWYLCGTSLFLAGNHHVSRWTVNHFRDRGIQTVVWTVDEPEEKAYLSNVLHVPYITDTLLPPSGS